MMRSRLVGETLREHMHNYSDTASGYWEWCVECQCMVNCPCQHKEYSICRDRSEYITLKARYEPKEE